MRAIIIQDHDAKTLLNELDRARLIAPQGTNLEDISGRRTVDQLANELHRKFHYVVCLWLQDQGADVVR